MACATTKFCVVSWHSLGTTVYSFSCVSNLCSLFCIFKIFKIIESPSPWEVYSLIWFLSSRNLSASDIHFQICKVYGTTAIYEGKVQEWVWDFKAGCNSFGWEVLDHSTYSLDFMPSDFYLFLCLKHYFSTNHCNNNKVLKTVVKFLVIGEGDKFLWRMIYLHIPTSPFPFNFKV